MDNTRVVNDNVRLSGDSMIAGRFHESSAYSVFRDNGTADWLLIYTVGGAGRIAGRETHVNGVPGSMVLIAPGTRHDYRTTADHWEILWTHFQARPLWSDLLTWPELETGLMHITVRDQNRATVERRMQQMVRWTYGKSRSRDQFALNALEEVLLWCDAEDPNGRDQVRDARIDQAVAYVYDHLGEPLSVQRLADAAGLSLSRFGHLFHETMGMTPRRFVEQQRLTRARQLLDLTERAVQDIAEDLGFESAFYFSTRFKAFSGYSPSHYRNLFRPN